MEHSLLPEGLKEANDLAKSGGEINLYESTNMHRKFRMVYANIFGRQYIECVECMKLNYIKQNTFPIENQTFSREFETARMLKQSDKNYYFVAFMTERLNLRLPHSCWLVSSLAFLLDAINCLKASSIVPEKME